MNGFINYLYSFLDFNRNPGRYDARERHAITTVFLLSGLYCLIALFFLLFFGLQALEKFEEFQPQVILMDVMMPDLDGPETLEKIKAQFDLSNIMVLFMTAKVQHEEVAHFKAIGGYAVIEKPFDPMTLSEKIQGFWESFGNN